MSSTDTQSGDLYGWVGERVHRSTPCAWSATPRSGAVVRGTPQLYTGEKGACQYKSDFVGHIGGCDVGHI